MKKAIIYDWDGTLCDSISIAFEATVSIFKRHNCTPPSFETYIETFGPPYTNFYWDNGFPKSVSDREIWEMYHEASNHQCAPLFDDVFEAICLQRSFGYNIGLVTGQRKNILESLMQKHKCTGLFDCIFCEVSPDKVSAFENSCKALNAQPHEVYSVGDFATDMRDSKRVGMVPVGIIRNGHNVSNILIKAGAKQIIRKLSELDLEE